LNRLGCPHIPRTFVLPEDRDHFRRAVDERNDILWIIKPPNGGCGKSIQILSNTQISEVYDKLYRKKVVISQYITNPLCVHQHKVR